MAGPTKSDWKLIATGVAIGALAVPVFQLLRLLTDSMATRFADSEGAPGDGAPARRGRNIINICIMGMMTSTRVNVTKAIPATRSHAEIKDAEHRYA